MDVNGLTSYEKKTQAKGDNLDSPDAVIGKKVTDFNHMEEGGRPAVLCCKNRKTNLMSSNLSSTKRLVAAVQYELPVDLIDRGNTFYRSNFPQWMDLAIQEGERCY